MIRLIDLVKHLSSTLRHIVIKYNEIKKEYYSWCESYISIIHKQFPYSNCN